MCQLQLLQLSNETADSAVQLHQHQPPQNPSTTTSTQQSPTPSSKVGSSARYRRRPRMTFTSNTQFSWWSTAVVVAILSIVSILATHSNASSEANNNNNNSDYLNENSTVLITGMAGFLGSSLAMALKRVYGVHHIIGIDSMDDGFGTAGARTPAELAEFDVRRQRLFHVLQELGVACHFYRVDLRPNIPDYQDRGEVPVLDSIFAAHPEITHVVHLADPYGMPQLWDEGLEQVPFKTQAVPRKKDQIKAGMMESLLEQLVKIDKLTHKMPHFTYASSSHVYNHYNPINDDNDGNHAKNPVPFDEAKPITTPSSLHGASKLIDEVLARTFYQTHQLYSVGLRFFDVYGPWSNPGTFLYDLTERAVRQAATGGDDSSSTNTNSAFVTEADKLILDNAARDYIFIDDAVDALLAAMQFRPATTTSSSTTGTASEKVPPPPVVLNVGTGQQTTARTIVSWVQQFLSTTNNNNNELPPLAKAGDAKRSISYASTERAKEWLGFEARVSLGEGLLQLLAWHHDRIFPFGATTTSTNNDIQEGPRHPMADQGIVSCSPFDAECLKGAPVFPCASECSHTQQCMPSFYDAVLEQTRQWTALCDAVLYTVDLDDDLTALPSATAVVSTTSQSHVVSPSGQHCNVAFVSSNCPLVKQLQQQQQQQGAALKHGFWTLVTVDVPSDQPVEFFLEFLPKLSPGMFFGGTTTKRIIYCDPDVIIDSIPNLLAEAAMQPFRNVQSTTTSNNDDDKTDAGKKESGGAGKDKPSKGATAMLIGKGRQSQSSFRKGDTPIQEAVQDTAYRSVRISVIDQLAGDGFALPLDSSFIVHTLQSAESRLFRCDVFAELIQWRVGTDQSAFEFVLELHDMWSRVIVKQNGNDPWWVGESVVTIPEDVSKPEAGRAGSRSGTSQKRRLQEVLQDNAGVDAKKEDDAVGETVDAVAPGGAKIVKVVDAAEGTDADEVAKENDNNAAAIEKADTINKAAAFESDEDNVAEDGDAEIIAARNNEEDKDDDTNADDDEEPEDGSVLDQGEVDVKAQEKDMSAYDTWMGVLSLSNMQYFVRIVPSSAAGVVVMDDYDF